MEQTVYADLLFLINFSMDLLCLFLTARILAVPFSLVRALSGAVLGGIYSVASLLFSTQTSLLPLDLAFCFLMCAVVCLSRREGLGRLLLFTGVFFLNSALLGGIMTAVFNLMNRSAPPAADFTAETDVPLWLFTLLALVAWTVTWVGGRFFRHRAQSPEAHLEIILGKRRAVVRALCDSGNLLIDPLSGRPVIVADLRVASVLLPADCPPLSSRDLSALPTSVAARMRLIPAASVGQSSLIPALRPDCIVVRVGNQTRKADALVGFAPLSATPSGIDAIVPPSLLT